MVGIEAIRDMGGREGESGSGSLWVYVGMVLRLGLCPCFFYFVFTCVNRV